MAGGIQLIKSIVLPKCLYVLTHSPVKIPKQIFKDLNSQMTRFIWAYGRCKLKLNTLQRPKTAQGWRSQIYLILSGRATETLK